MPREKTLPDGRRKATSIVLDTDDRPTRKAEATARAEVDNLTLADFVRRAIDAALDAPASTPSGGHLGDAAPPVVHDDQEIPFPWDETPAPSGPDPGTTEILARATAVLVGQKFTGDRVPMWSGDRRTGTVTGEIRAVTEYHSVTDRFTVELEPNGDRALVPGKLVGSLLEHPWTRD